MSSYRAWRGAIELAGFPINVALYSRVRKARSESFRMLAPSGQPIITRLIDPETDNAVERADTRKGVEIGPDQYVPLTPEAVEQITSGTKTVVAKLEALCPLDTIALDLAIDRFAVLPDDKVPGSEQSVNVIWNGLRDSDMAYVTQVSLRGGHDAILVLYADDVGFWAALLPFEDELYEYPVHDYVEDSQQAAMFEQFVQAQYDDKVGSFDHAAFASEYRARRNAAIAAVLEGTPIEVVKEPKPVEGPDLMAMLAAGAKAKPKAKAKARKPSQKTTATVVKA